MGVPADASKLRQLLDEFLADEALRVGALLPDERLASLVSALEALPAFATIRGKYLNTGRGSLGFSNDLVALAVLRRAQEKGIAQALREFDEFLTQDTR